MKYDFEKNYDRKGMDASAFDAIGEYKWGFEPDAPKEDFDAIPMWVADMNFATCPAVTDAIIKRAQHPIFGYFSPSDEYYDAIIKWHRRNGEYSDLKKEYIGYENGVHGFVTSALKVLTKPGDSVLLHSPYYVGYAADLKDTGLKTVFSELVRDENGTWRMDYADMDRKIKENNIRVSIFCSPHNPSGRVWEREEIEKALAVYEANGVTVISDEIWADIVFAGQHFTPTLCVNDWAKEHVVTGCAPSKTFNLAGLIGSYHIIYNDELREKITKCGEETHYNDMNVLSMHALIGGYSECGAEWLGELTEVLEGNARFAYDYISEHFEGVSTAMPQGTYMMFLDCTENAAKTGRTIDDILKAGWDVGVTWQDGRKFNGPCHIRINLASPLPKIKEAFRRMDKYVF